MKNYLYGDYDFYQKNKYCSLLLLLFWSSQLLGQGDKNPFELQYRADRKAKLSGLKDIVETPTEETTKNPFDVIRTPQKVKPTTATAAVNPNKIEKKKTTLPQVVEDKNFRFSLTMTMLILLALITSIYRNQLIRAYRAFSNENVMRMLHREKGTVAYFPYYILYALFIFNAGILIYLLLRHFQLTPEIGNLTLLGITTGGFALILLLKQLVVNILGWVFPIEKETSIYNMTITIFGIVLSIVLFVANIIIAYAPPNIVPFAIYFFLGVIGLIYLFRAVRGLSIGAKFLNHNKFHFFIYLCTVEIAPVLILWKMLGNGIGIQ